MENSHKSPFEEWYRQKKRKIRQKLPSPNPWERYLNHNEIALDWLSSDQPSVLQGNALLEKKTRNHFSQLTTQHESELLNLPIDHIPQHIFPEYLGALVRILIQLDDVKEIKEKDKIGGLTVPRSVIYAFLTILVEFEEKTFFTPLKVEEEEIVTVDEVKGLESLARGEKCDKNQEISVFHLKELLGSAVLLGPPDTL